LILLLILVEPETDHYCGKVFISLLTRYNIVADLEVYMGAAVYI